MWSIHNWSEKLEENVENILYGTQYNTTYNNSTVVVVLFLIVHKNTTIPVQSLLWYNYFMKERDYNLLSSKTKMRETTRFAYMLYVCVCVCVCV